MKKISLRERDKTVECSLSTTFVENTASDQPDNPAKSSDKFIDNQFQPRTDSDRLKDSDESIIDSMADALFVLDRDLRITRLNRAALELTKYSGSELAGQSIKLLLPDDVFSDLRSLEHQARRIDTICHTKDKEIIPVCLSVSVVARPADPATAIVCTFQDITEQKRVETELRKNVAKFQDLFENAPVAYHELDMEGRFTRINRAGEKLLGYTSEELKGRFPWEIIVEKVSRDAIAEKLSGKAPLKPVERTIVRKDGTLICVSNEDRLIYDVEGKVTGIRSTLQDITERKRAEAEAQVIFEVIQGVSTSSNLDGLLQMIHHSIEKVIDARNFFVALYDAPTEMLTMQFFVDQYDPAPPPIKLGRGLTAYIFRQNRAKLITPKRIEELTEQGEIELIGTAPAIWLGVPLKIGNRTIGVLVVQHYENENAYSQRDLDLLISVGDQIALAIERKQTEDQLKIYNERLQQSNRELQDFAYVASHDLQEPLRKIQAFGDRLERRHAEALGEEGGDYVKRMRHAAKRMQILIEDLLTFSRVTTKAQPFVPVNLEEITHDVLSDLEVRIEQTGATIEVEPLPQIDADPLQMRQLMQNLIGNALKFRQAEVPPTIKITGGAAGINSTYGNVCQITVADNGIGFEEKYTDRIFTVFQRLHGRGEYEGSGVGLAVCRKIVERHHGTITAKSAPNEGATFIITLPVKQIEMEINQ